MPGSLLSQKPHFPTTEICTCCSACFRNSSSCSSLLSGSRFLLLSLQLQLLPVNRILISAFSFKNSKALPPLLRLFLVLPPAGLLDFFLKAMRSMAFFLLSSAVYLSSDFFFSFSGNASPSSSMSASFLDNSQSMPLARSSSHWMC